MRFAVILMIAVIFLGGCHDDGTPAPSGPTAPTPPAAVIPSITAQPSDQSVVAGQPATFSVTATGTAPLAYQWQRDAQPISGATSSSYTLGSTALADSGAKFTVAVSNSVGSTASNSAMLTVTSPISPSHVVTAADGGQVSSDDGQVTINLPPNALTADATVTISAPGADWTVPASLPAQFAVVPGTTRVISTQGGAFDPNVRFNISISIAGLPADSASGAHGALPERAKAASRTQPKTLASFTTWTALGISIDCGDGKPVIIIMPPSDSYGTGTFMAGCPAPISTSVVTWTPPVSQAPTPAGNIIWDTAIHGVVPLSADSLPSCTAISCESASRGDTFTGSTTYTIAAAVLDYQFEPGNFLIALVDGNGQLLAQDLQQFPLDNGIYTSLTNILLDGPANFYLTLGSNRATSLVSRYALQFSANSAASFQKLWVSTLTGVAVSSSDTTDPSNVVGTTFAVDPSTGALVGLAGTGPFVQLSSDDRARLKSSADAFVVRLDRTGKLAWATPVMSTESLSFNGTALRPQRFLDYALNIDHAGNAYVATALCCAAQNQAGISGVTLKKIDALGSLTWEANLGGPDQVGGALGGPLDEGSAASLAVDSNGNSYVTYYRDNVSGSPQSSHMYVSKVSPSGSIAGIGYVDPAVEASHFAIPSGERSLSSYIDDSGILYLPVDFLGSPASSELIGLDPSLNVIGQTQLPLQTLSGGFQVDASGNIYQQQSNWNGPPAYIVDLKKFHF